MEDVFVHPHALRHGLTEGQVLEAWENFQVRQPRSAPREDELVAVGYTRAGVAVQMVGVVHQGFVLVIHAMAPPTRGFLLELGLMGRQ